MNQFHPKQKFQWNITWAFTENSSALTIKGQWCVLNHHLPQPWASPRNHWGKGCGQALTVEGPCCRGLQRHHQTQSHTPDCSSNIPPPVQSKVTSPSMTRQPWLTKAVIDHCPGKRSKDIWWIKTIWHQDVLNWHLVMMMNLDLYFENRSILLTMQVFKWLVQHYYTLSQIPHCFSEHASSIYVMRT